MALTPCSMPSSGNSHKVRLLPALLGRPCTEVSVEAASPELRAVQASGALPLGAAPALHLEGGAAPNGSGAILWDLGAGRKRVPGDRLAQSRTLAWMLFEPNRHEPVLATRSSLRVYPRPRGSFDMARFPRIGVWLGRIAAVRGHVALGKLP